MTTNKKCIEEIRFSEQENDSEPIKFNDDKNQCKR